MILYIILDLTFVFKGDDRTIGSTVLEDEEGVQIETWKMIITLPGWLVHCVGKQNNHYGL